MRLLVFFSFFSFFQFANSQIIDTLYLKIYSSDFDYIGLFDKDILVDMHFGYNGRKIFLNSLPIDSSGMKIYAFPKYLKGEIYIYSIDTNSNQFVYHLKNDRLIKNCKGEISQDGFSNNLISVEKFNKIYLINNSNFIGELLLDLSEKLKLKWKWIDDNSMIITDEFWLNEDILFFNYASCSVSCFDFTHYLFNKSELTLKEIKYLKSGQHFTKDEFTLLELVDSTHKSVLGFISHSNDSNYIGRWLFNDTLKRKTKLLSMNHAYMVKAPEGHFDYSPPGIAGYNFQNKQPAGINYRSSLDNNFNVIVPYKFNVQQEIAMLKVFYDTLLTQQEIAGFGKYELSVLRNLIFAKHNYKFDSEFWQAYFNLFEFYRSDESRKSRTKDVEKKFSSADRKNMEMIKKREKNVKI